MSRRDYDDDYAPGAPRFEARGTLTDAQRNRDLGVILAENRDLRTDLQGVQYLYVPIQPTGCVFQALQLMEGVSKGK